MSYMEPKIWDLLPEEIKHVTTLNEFNAKMKISKLENCLYRVAEELTFHRKSSLHNVFYHRLMHQH